MKKSVAKNLLDSLKMRLLLCFRFSLQNPKSTLVAATVAWLICLIPLAKGFDLLVAIEDLLDPGRPGREHVELLKQKFKLGNALQAFVHIPSGNFTHTEGCAVRKWMNGQRRSNPSIVRSRSSFDAVKSVFPGGQVMLYRSFLHVDCDVPEDSFTPGFTELRQSNWGPWLSPLKIPGAEDIVVEFDFSRSAGEDFSPAHIQALEQSFKDEVQRRFPRLQIEWTGESAFQLAMWEGNRQVSALNGVVLLFLLLMFRFFFGTWSSGLLYVVSISWTATLVFGLMAWFKTPLDPLAASVFLMITVSCLEDFVFFLHASLQDGSTWRRSLRRLLLPGFLTSLTTIIGFLSLGGAEQGMIRRFGTWCGVGAILEGVCTFLILPALLKTFPRWTRLTRPDRAYGQRFFSAVSAFRFPKRLSYGLLAIFPIALASLPLIKIADAPMEFFKNSHPLRRAQAYLAQSRGWEASVQIVFPSSIAIWSTHPKGDALREKQQRAALAQVKSSSDVIAIESPYDWIDGLVRGQNPETERMIRRELSEAPPLAQWISPDLVSRASVFVKATDLDTIRRVRDQIAKACQGLGCFAAGSFVAYAEFIDLIPMTLLKSFLMSLILVSAVLIWLARANQVREIPALLLATLWGPAVLFTVIILSGLPFNLMTCTFAAVIVGLAGDNAVQFLLSENRRSTGLSKGMSHRGPASVLCAVMMALASLLFLGSYFKPHHGFGMLLAGGLIAGVVGDLLILRGLLSEQSTSKPRG